MIDVVHLRNVFLRNRRDAVSARRVSNLSILLFSIFLPKAGLRDYRSALFEILNCLQTGKIAFKKTCQYLCRS
jgi:hypothetical protein